VLLNLNPGHKSDDDAWHERESFAARSRRNLLHEGLDYPFYLLDPHEPSPGHHWWRRKLSPLIDATSLAAVAHGVLCVEFFPYHSHRFAHRDVRVPSQSYSFELVERAIERRAIVVLMRSENLWFAALPMLAGYSRLLRVRNVQNPTLSGANLSSSAFAEIVCAIAGTRTDTSKQTADGRHEFGVPFTPLSKHENRIARCARRSLDMSNDMDSAGRDITQFCVTLGSQSQSHLPKRRAMLAVARYLVSRGVSPDAIAEKMVGRRPNQRWFEVADKHDGLSFLRAAQLRDPSFDPKRWFVGTDELVHFGRNTYALSNQWGSKTFPPTIESLEHAFAAFAIKVSPEP
jgi:hypothetical protein